MPVTRSAQGFMNRPSTVEEQPSGATKATGSSRTVPTAMGSISTISATPTLATSVKSQKITASKKEDQAMAGKSSTRSKSARTSLAAERARRKREVELRVELNRRVLQEAQAAAALARSEMELLKLDEEDAEDMDSADEEPEDRAEGVHSWVEATVNRMSGGGHRGEEGTSAEGRPGEVLPEERLIKPQDPTAAVVKPEDKGMEASGAGALAEAIMKAISTAPRSGYTHQPAYVYELPVFDGSCGEWLAFRTVYEDTAPLFSSVQNMARLRKAIKGTAREAVRSILYSECTPGEVLESLRRRFGRPEALVLAELEKVKNLPRTTENARDVCVFASTINNTVATINGLKKPQYLNSPEMIKEIIDKLPVVLKYRWFDFAAEHDDPDLSLIAKFLNREAERCGPYATQEVVAKKTVYQQRQTTHAAMESEGAQQLSCPHCAGNHSMDVCKKFQQAPVTERWVIAKKSGLCFKCLRSRHRKETCRRPPCKLCRRWHHHLLHEDKEQPDHGFKDHGSSSIKGEVAREVATNVHLSSDQVNTTKGAKAYLKMVPVEVYGPNGKAKIMALLDEGSTVTLLDSKVAEEIGLQGPKEPLSLETVGGRVIKNDDSMRVDVKLRGLHQSQRRKISGARTIDGLRLTPQRIDKSRLEEYTHLRKLASRLWYDEESPRLLIGQDNWELIISRATRKGKRCQPAASLTHLGWVLHGLDGQVARRVDYGTCAHVSTRDDDSDQLVKEHFAIESPGVQPHRPRTEGRAIDIPKDSNGGHRWFTGPKFLEGEKEYRSRARSFKHEPTGEKELQFKHEPTGEKELQVTTATRVREKLLFLEKRAEREFLRRSRQESFDDAGKIKELDIIEEDSLLHIRGRIEAIQVFDYKRSVIVDGKNQVARLTIAHFHEKFYPGNNVIVINEVRQKFWILGLQAAVTEADLNGRRQRKVVQRLADHFWARWVKEYIPTLAPRRVDGKVNTRNLQCGDTVLIVDSTLPRNCWPRGQVVSTYPGPEGRTAGGVLKRPYSKAVLLVPTENHNVC